MAAEEFTLGVEEEYQIVGPQTRQLKPRSQTVLHQAARALGDLVQPEFHESQIEIATPVCRTLADVRAQLVKSRKALIAAAARDGDRIVAAGTHPFSHGSERDVTPKPRYRDMAHTYGWLALEHVIFGCHVHVSLSDTELGVAVMNRARLWLAPLLALTANSPFWLGEDTEYASFRTEVWVRWPLAGPPLPFESRAEHDALVEALVATGSISDATKIYWDIRLPRHLPTIEFRVADVCARIDEAVMLAGLVRGLVRTCDDEARRDAPWPRTRPELLRAAHWRAARYGLEGEMIDLVEQKAVPATALVQTLLDKVRPALEAAGDWEETSALVAQTLQEGNGAMRQREVYRRNGSMEDVVDSLIAETARGTE